MAKTRVGEIKCTDGRYENKINVIVEDLDRGLNPREIANRRKVPYGVVAHVHKRYKSLLYSMKNKEENNEETVNEEIIIETVPDQVQQEEKVEDKKVSKYKGTQISGKRDKLSDDVILQIIEMDEHKIPKTKIAEELGIAYSTVCRYAKEYSMNKTTRKKTASKSQTKKSSTKRVHSGRGKSFNNKTGNKQTSSNVSEEIQSSVNKSIQKMIDEDTESVSSSQNIISAEYLSPDIGIYKQLPSLKCGLIKDRHDMPTNMFIFDKVQESIMFKYDELDRIVSEFIKKEVGIVKDENGEEIGARELVVYVTGLTCCIGSLIKMCDKFKVNLTLMHFNNRNGEYHKQVIYDKFGKGYINKLFPTASYISLHDLGIEEMKKDRFFVIRTVELHEDGNNIISFDVFKDQTTLWLHHGSILSKTMINTKQKIAVYVDLCEIVEDRISSINKVSSVYNWSKSTQ